MAIADTIQSMYDNVSNAYNVLEVAGADLTNVDKNILNLKTTWQERLLYFMNNGTDVVWNNWDKVTGEGTSISLNNTLEGKMKIDLKGNTSQESTTGKNKLPLPQNDTTTINGITYKVDREKGTITANGTATANANLLLLKTYNTNEEDYFVSGCPSGGGNSTYTIYTQGNNDNGNGVIVNTSNGYIGVRVYRGYTANNVVFYPMLEKGSSKTTFEKYTGGNPAPNPDYPQDIHVVSGDNSIVVCGKNLFNSAKLNHLAFATRSNIEILISANTYIGYALPCNEGEVYSISRLATTNSRFRVMFSSEEPAQDVPIFGGTGNVSTYDNALKIENIVVPSGAKYMNIYLSNAGETIPPIQIEKGNQATTYEPYKGASYPISLGDIELCKIGTYQDKIFKNTPNTTDYNSELEDNVWYVKKEIGKVVFDGTQTWQKRTDIPNLTNTSCFRSDYSTNVSKDMTSNTPQISNLFECLNNTNDIEHLRYTNIQYYRFQLFINKSRLSSDDETGLNNFLSSNNMIVYYVLATPTITEITDSTLLSQLEALKKTTSYDGQTNISQNNNDLASILNATALKEMS